MNGTNNNIPNLSYIDVGLFQLGTQIRFFFFWKSVDDLL